MGLQCHSKNEMIQTKMLKILFIFYSLSLLSADSHLYLLFQLSGPSLTMEFWWQCMADLVGLRWWFDLVGFGGGLLARKHGRGTRGAAPASDAVAHTSDCVCGFFFFFFLGFAPTWLDLPRRGSIRAKSASIRAKSGWFGQNQVVSTADRYGWNRLKSALNLAGKAEILTFEA